MSDEAACQMCGTSDLHMVVQHGSYILACKACGDGPASSFVSVARHLTGFYRAAIIDENWNEIGPVDEGSGPDFMEKVRNVAQSGAKVLITPLDN